MTNKDIAALVNNIALLSCRCENSLLVIVVVEFDDYQSIVVWLAFPKSSVCPVDLNGPAFSLQAQCVRKPPFSKNFTTCLPSVPSFSPIIRMLSLRLRFSISSARSVKSCTFFSGREKKVSREFVRSSFSETRFSASFSLLLLSIRLVSVQSGLKFGEFNLHKRTNLSSHTLGDSVSHDLLGLVTHT